MKRPLSLRWQLSLLIVGGILALLIAPLIVKSSLCPAKHPSGWNINQPQDANVKQGPAEQSHEGAGISIPDWLCEETKITDLALVFFTYCLVIIGWIGIKSGEKTVRDLERAYVFAAPAKIMHENGTTSIKISIDNAGRTPGVVKFVCAEFGLALPSGPNPTYPNGKRLLIDVAVNSSAGLNPLDPDNKILLPSIYRTSVMKPHYFWGYVEYIDIFRRTHRSRFCTLISPPSPQFDHAGGEAWNEWD